MAAVRMDHKGQKSRSQGGSMTWGMVKLFNSESQIKVKGDGWVALERIQIMGMRPECRSHWETQEDPRSWLLLLSLFPSLWILEPILFLPAQLLHILLSTHWLSLIAYSFLSLNNFSFSELALTSSPPTAEWLRGSLFASLHFWERAPDWLSIP